MVTDSSFYAGRGLGVHCLRRWDILWLDRCEFSVMRNRVFVRLSCGWLGLADYGSERFSSQSYPLLYAGRKV